MCHYTEFKLHAIQPMLQSTSKAELNILLFSEILTTNS